MKFFEFNQSIVSIVYRNTSTDYGVSHIIYDVSQTQREHLQLVKNYEFNLRIVALLCSSS